MKTAALTGFGQAIGEIGAIMIIGGNIDHLTRVMTTGIALEVGEEDFFTKAKTLEARTFIQGDILK